MKQNTILLLLAFIFLSVCATLCFFCGTEASKSRAVFVSSRSDEMKASTGNAVFASERSDEMEASTGNDFFASEQGSGERSNAELADEYRTLRKKKGHFNGGEWADDLDRWDGRMHSVMAQLGQNLGTPEHTESEITGLMGEPDSRPTVNGDTHLIYLWRGWHDYLYFICRNGRVKESRWYFAYE